MVGPLDFVQLAVVLAAALATLTAAGVLWLRRPRTHLVSALAVLLVFLAQLALVRGLLLLPTAGLAPRLLPVVHLAVTTAALAFLVFLFEPRLAPRRLDALLSSVIVAGLGLGALALWRPELYWGDTAELGPLHQVAGVWTLVFAVAAWLLAAHALARRALFRHVPRGAASLLSAGLVLVAVHDAVGPFLQALLDGSPLRGPQYLALPVVLGLVAHVAVLAVRAGDPVRRAAARRHLLVGLVPALLSVTVVDLLVFRLVSDAGGVRVDAVLQHLWTIGLACGAVWAVRPRLPLRTVSPSAAPGPPPAAAEP